MGITQAEIDKCLICGRGAACEGCKADCEEKMAEARMEPIVLEDGSEVLADTGELLHTPAQAYELARQAHFKREWAKFEALIASRNQGRVINDPAKAWNDSIKGV